MIDLVNRKVFPTQEKLFLLNANWALRSQTSQTGVSRLSPLVVNWIKVKRNWVETRSGAPDGIIRSVINSRINQFSFVHFSNKLIDTTFGKHLHIALTIRTCCDLRKAEKKFVWFSRLRYRRTATICGMSVSMLTRTLINHRRVIIIRFASHCTVVSTMGGQMIARKISITRSTEFHAWLMIHLPCSCLWRLLIVWPVAAVSWRLHQQRGSASLRRLRMHVSCNGTAVVSVQVSRCNDWWSMKFL